MATTNETSDSNYGRNSTSNSTSVGGSNLFGAEYDFHLKEKEIDVLKRNVLKAVPKEIHKYLKSDLIKLSQLPVFGAEFHQTLKYLEYISELPWKRIAKNKFEQTAATNQLNKVLYGLREVKEKVLEYLILTANQGNKRAPILNFLGPPGVGKVTLAMTIAECMDVPIERINLATAYNKNALLGESRHHLHANGGKILQAINRSGVKNPVILLEELDYIDWEQRDNAGLALIDLLDSRNLDFIDEYLGVPFDISQVWFILTSHSLDGVPRLLREQIDTIEFSGYTDYEKEKIAAGFLIPDLVSKAGLLAAQCEFQKKAIDAIIGRYTRESGVVKLKKNIRKIVRKCAKKVNEDPSSKCGVTSDSLAHFLGPELFFREENRRADQIGVSAGLVWTEYGGEVISIEAAKLPKGRGLILTGRLGKVMRESAETAHSYLWAHSSELSIDVQNFTQCGIHLHIPAGSIPKDGPSAGLPMLMALASLFLDLAVPHDIAMSAEVTLTGQIFPVGGVREKILAAHRAGFRRVFLPKENETDLQVLPKPILKDLDFIFVSKVSEILPLVFPKFKKRTVV